MPHTLNINANLLAAMVGELGSTYGRFDPAKSPSATPDDMWGPRGSFLVIYRAGVPVAGGGIKPR